MSMHEGPEGHEAMETEVKRRNEHTERPAHVYGDSQETLRMEKGQTDAGPEKILELLSHNSSLIQEALHSHHKHNRDVCRQLTGVPGKC